MTAPDAPPAGRARTRRHAAARILLFAAAAIAAASPVSRAAAPGTELPPAAAGGIERLDPLLRKLTTNRRLLVIAAHPDDEDTPLLTLVSRGMGGEAAYLSLSRGDGGQNLIGDELGVGLGLIRTEELNAARRLDGARQFFTRAYDFGFSKSVEETFRFWPKEALLEDAVRVIRRFRPQVVVSVFSGTPRDGHGQHQAAGIVAREAFRLAGDAKAFPEREGPAAWQPQTLYQSTRFLDRDKTTLTLPIGGLEPLTGRSFLQIAVASRSLHRSQGTGALQPIGPNEARVGWIEGGAGREAKDLFAGTDTSLAGLAAAIGDPARRRDAEARLSRAETMAREVRQKATAADLGASVPGLASILEQLRAARALAAADSGAASMVGTLDEKISAAEAALACAAGLAIDALADSETAIPGEAVPVTVQLSNAGREAVEVESAALVSPVGWTVPAPAAGHTVAAGTLADWKLSATVPAAAPASAPYFLRHPLRGAMYDWTGVTPAVKGEPFEPRALSAVVVARVGGTRVTVSREATFRYRDEEFGEIRHQVRAVPKVEVSTEPDLIVWPTSQTRPSKVSVTLVSNSRDPVSGRVSAKLPAGWAAAEQPFSLARKGDRAQVDLTLAPSGGVRGGGMEVPVVATLASGETFSRTIRIVDYQHIRPIPWPRDSNVAIQPVDLKLPPLRNVGYVRGASDRVPEALIAVGVPIQVLGPRELEHGDLSRYDAIVIGSRAYETEPALDRANGRLLDYVRSGGLMIVQYQQTIFTERGYGPEKLEITRPISRVTDEGAPVRMLEPADPIFTTPNRIGPADWEGWVQERGIYFATTWAPAFRPLLAMADPGEPEQKGALLVAAIGKGHYVYTGLAFFRELPAGVPGAYRLFANLLAWKPAAREAVGGRR